MPIRRGFVNCVGLQPGIYPMMPIEPITSSSVSGAAFSVGDARGHFSCLTSRFPTPASVIWQLVEISGQLQGSVIVAFMQRMHGPGWGAPLTAILRYTRFPDASPAWCLDRCRALRKRTYGESNFKEWKP